MPNDTKIATVGSPSSNSRIVLNVAKTAFGTPLVGQVVTIENPMNEGSELALGTVTEVTTNNRWHQDQTFQGVIRNGGDLAGMSGNSGDIRDATIQIQAAWNRTNENAAWKPSGPTLRTSPATGTPVSILNGQLIQELVAETTNIAYMGHLGGSDNIPLPLTIPDFASSLGAIHMGVYGLSGSGKALDVNTPIATPTGWTTMGELNDGDTVFDEQGKPCRVVKAHAVMYDRPCYEVEFSDGSVIVADAEHLWLTHDASPARRGKTHPGPRARHGRLSPKTTQRLLAAASTASPLDVITVPEVETQFDIRNDDVLREAITTVGPAGTVTGLHVMNATVNPRGVGTVTVYPKAAVLRVLANLGNPSQSSRVRSRVLETRQIAETLLTADGYANHAVPVAGVLDLPESDLLVPPYTLGAWLTTNEAEHAIQVDPGDLQTIGVFDRKHIPALYLRSSAAQRRALLAGLTDSDYVTMNGKDVAFTHANETLTRNVFELVASLGYQPTLTSETVNGSTTWTTTWNTGTPASRDIVRVELINSRPVRCITVDSENALYLAGAAFIPTHNTAVTGYLLASQMRHEQHGILIVDPQGQWSTERELPFSLQGFAKELGRDVIVRRISEDLRLAKNPDLFVTLLKYTEITKEVGMKDPTTTDNFWYEFSKALERREWVDTPSPDLLRALLNDLLEDRALSRIYTSEENQERFRNRITDLIDDPIAFTNATQQFGPIHNLFQHTNPDGGTRYSLNATLRDVFTRSSTEPAPLVILDMSSKTLPGLDDDVDEASETSTRILDNDVVKAAILRNAFHTLKRASESSFREGSNLNTLIVLDEAWRYAAPPGRTDEPEMRALSTDLAGYARDTRKFGIGWLYISQSTRSINLDIWDQMTIRLFGYGLAGQDLDKMSEIVDDKSSIQLYRTSGNPRATNVFPFMLTGPVSPLAANSTPVMLHVYKSFDLFREDNAHWISPVRARLGLPVLTGLPEQPTGTATLRPRARPAGTGSAASTREAIVTSSRAASANRHAVGVQAAAGYSDPLSTIDDDEPPF